MPVKQIYARASGGKLYPGLKSYLSHPIFQLIGMRNVVAEHTHLEEAKLQEYAKNKKSLVEIGVAEGASALALQKVADITAVLYLIDPYLSNKPLRINFSQIVAHRRVDSRKNPNVFWIRDFSYNAAKNWERSIDFLFIDGDHSYDACLKDWKDWSPFVVQEGIVALHDARVFAGGWTAQESGPVRVVNELFRKNNNTDFKIIDEIDSLVILQRIRASNT